MVAWDCALMLRRARVVLPPVRARCVSMDSFAGSVPVPAARLEQLLEAEVTDLSLRCPQPLALHKILELAAASDKSQLAHFLHEELPVRFAQRIKMLEALPEWESQGAISSVRRMYLTSFKELRLANPAQSTAFQEQIQKIKERHSQTNLLVGGFKRYAEVKVLQEDQINKWLDRFFTLRISTNMLMSHYLQISGRVPNMRKLEFDPSYNPYRSSIDPACNAPRIARHAAHVVESLCRARYGVSPKIQVEDVGSQAFPFVPRYFFYIVSELMKNSVRATVETHGGVNPGPEVESKLPPVVVLISGDEKVCGCRVSDQGGGIDDGNLNRVWSYLYTTAEPIKDLSQRMAVDAPADLHYRTPDERREGPQLETVVKSRSLSPLAGLGCGLPLSRLYARYLGGSVELQSMPRYGTDVYVYLNRLGKCHETPDSDYAN